MTEARRPATVAGGSELRFAPGVSLAGRYRVVSLIGEGAIGEVYEAFDEALAEPLALKTLRAQVASQAVTVERFRREIQLARKVTHRNVCRTYDLGRHEMPGRQRRHLPDHGAPARRRASAATCAARGRLHDRRGAAASRCR